ncbi:MAG: GspE/PulE family protein, partial [Candidatus Gracilibacteria bacterium]|nr:GspE/PulE family protein [Candidatus Gracilibacteria bacterium]
IVTYTTELIEHALKLWASDIHIEPSKNFVGIRFRSCGDFVLIDKLSSETYIKLLSRIKIMAGVRIDEKQKPQDGKINYISERNDNEPIDIRVSALPIINGEKIVMRVLRQNIALLSLDKMEFFDINLERIKASLGCKYGMILVAGPTGSGKSTTLFSMLRHFNPLEYNITTLEDPIEYDIPYINQTQVKPQIGFDFASGLKSIVRQDPDIIMVGEIRDKETATLAIEAALTGHLVFSTIHTNSAAGTIQRLINMDVEPFLVASSLRLIISQRLVKRICQKCKVEQEISPEKRKKVIQYLGPILEENPENIIFYKGAGCEDCMNTGYAGRIGVHEAIIIDDKFDALILNKASVNEIEKKAKEFGMVTLIQDGLIKAATGKTTIDEALKLN